jgi:hypothetical protein
MPHSPYFGPGLIATLHVIAARLPDSMCERFYCELEATPLGAAIDARDGHMQVPQRPGLGIPGAVIPRGVLHSQGQKRRIDPLPMLSACPLRSDRVRTFAPQQFDARCQYATKCTATINRQSKGA